MDEVSQHFESRIPMQMPSRQLLEDPNGALVDVSSERPPDPAWLASFADL